ncbi:MAG: hypothetical protein B6U88_00215 [Candidatus Aenigmarchaeota archaeon ex4484_56]|nr:MAG: hypothetical protein B6U88_00215 [Candidatus Aenigmarchaeota archaeon ex4484_56]
MFKNFLSRFSSKKKRKDIQFPESSSLLDIKSLEYEIFLEEEKLASIPKTLYEKMTKISERILPVDPDEKTKKELEEAIEFAYLKVTPRGVTSFTILGTSILSITILLIIIFGYVSLIIGLVTLCGIFGLGYYFYYYPLRLKKIYELRAGSEIVMLILHIVIFMRNFPNLEGAVIFASSNLTGPLTYDMKKLIWDVHMGTYNSMEQALSAYARKWMNSFKAFSDATNAIIYSLYTSGKRRIELLDEAVDIILTSLKERSNDYVTMLNTPITMINALGILLPTLVLTLLPITTIFLGSEIPPSVIFGFYDVILPMILIFIIKNILDQRVITMPEPDLSRHPDLPPKNKFRLWKFFIPSYIPAIAILIPFLIYWYHNNVNMGIYQSFVVTAGFFASLFAFFYLNSFQKVKIRREIIEMEDEFREVLFALGQEIDRGIPLELALEKIMPTLRGHYSLDLLRRIISNMKYKSMIIKEAIFNQKEGAIIYFPSKLIYSILRAVIDAAEKGTKIVSEIMLSISRYLTDIHKTQKDIDTKFSEVLGSMNMQAKILLPLICGVMNIVTYTIVEMLSFLGETIGTMSTEGAASNYGFITGLWQNLHISPSVFQLSVGFYAIETIIILSWFINGIRVGVDNITLNDTIAKNLLIGGFMYIAISIAALLVFSPFITMVKGLSGG